MNFGIIKLGGRITWSSSRSTVVGGEAMSICKMLLEGGANLHIFTEVRDEDKDSEVPANVTWRQMAGDNPDMDTSGLDALIVINGNVNFFAGACIPEQLRCYPLINAFQGKVFYLQCDPAIPLIQIYRSVLLKSWKDDWDIDTIKITREDITVLTQASNTEAAEKLWVKQRGVKVEKFVHFPFERFPLLNDWLTAAAPEDLTVDLIYGGTARGGRRAQNVMNLYFGVAEDISVELFGRIKLEDFTTHKKIMLDPTTIRVPAFTGQVRYDKVNAKVNKALCHVVTGDDIYFDVGTIPQRTYEAVVANTVVFIDARLDTQKRIYDADGWLRVKNAEEVTEKIRILKNDNTLRTKILEEQRSSLNFDRKAYCTSCVDLIGSLVA